MKRRMLWVWGGVLLFALPVLPENSGAEKAAKAEEEPKKAGPPARMVSFFTGRDTCPAGWEASTTARGRLIVGTTSGGNVGVTVNSALASRQEPRHSHSFSFSATLSQKGLNANEGGNDTRGARKGSYTGRGTANTDDSRLPFYEYLACRVPLGGIQ